MVYVDWAKNGEEAIDLTYKMVMTYIYLYNVPLISGDWPS